MPSGLTNLLPLLLIVVAFYFLVLRPAKNRQAAAAATVSKLQPGVDVVTTSGLHGRVQRVEDGIVHLEVADGVVLRFVAAAIGKVADPAPAATESGTTDEARPSLFEGDTPTS